MGGGSSEEELERPDESDSSEGSSRSSRSSPPSGDAPQLVITQQPRATRSVPSGCGLGTKKDENSTRGAEAGEDKTSGKAAPQVKDYASEEGSVRLTPEEGEWIARTEELIEMVNVAQDQEEEWDLLDDLKRHVGGMALRCQRRTDGDPAGDWTRLLSHLSRWSTRSPLKEVLKSTAKTLVLMEQSKQRKQQGNMGRQRESPPRASPLVPAAAASASSDVESAAGPIEDKSVSGLAPAGGLSIPRQDQSWSGQTIAGPKPGAVMRTSTPQAEAPVVRSSREISGKVLSSSLPVRSANEQRCSSRGGRSVKSSPGVHETMREVIEVIKNNAPGGVAVPSNRSSEDRRMARETLREAGERRAESSSLGRHGPRSELTVGRPDPPARQTPQRSASGSMADATESELQAVSDGEGGETKEEEAGNNEDEEYKEERSEVRPKQQQAEVASPVTQLQSQDTEAPQPVPIGRVQRVDATRFLETSEEEERLSGYLIEAHALDLEPPRWRSTLALEGASENTKSLFQELHVELEVRQKKIERLQHLIKAFGKPYTDYTRVNEVMLKLRSMKRTDEAIRTDLTMKREKIMLAKTCAAAGNEYHSMRFVLPENFGTKSYIDVDRPLSRLQRCTDKNRHQIRTWMEKLFHTTATWEMSEQAYHEAIMNMMEGDVGARLRN